MRIDGVPNVRRAPSPCARMRVERQNAWPSADRDVHGWLNTLSFMMPPGFCKIFQRPRWAWPFVEPFIRSKAGLGQVPHEPDHRRRRKIDLHPEVIGAGAAGLAAAAEAAEAGASVVLLEQGREAGGHLLGDAGVRARAGLVRRMSESGVRFLPETSAFGVFGGMLVAAAGPDALYRIRAARDLRDRRGRAGGGLPGNDLPGVMVSSAVELFHRYGVLPGRRAVVLAGSNDAYSTAWALKDAGAFRHRRRSAGGGRLAGRIPGRPGSTILAAHGRRRVTGVTAGVPGSGRGQKVTCDLVVIACLQAPSTNLLAQAGGRLAFDEEAKAFLPAELPSAVHAVGAVAGARTPTRRSRRAGSRVSRPRPRSAIEPARTTSNSYVPPPRRRPIRWCCRPTRLPRPASSSRACAWMSPPGAEDRDVGGLRLDGAPEAVHDDHDGALPREGVHGVVAAAVRTCHGPGVRGDAPDDGAPALGPGRARHAGGRAADAAEGDDAARPPRRCRRRVHVGGGWRRPHHYTTPEEEVDAVRNRVGVIDVSTLGTFRITGSGAVELLERLYPVASPTWRSGGSATPRC